MAGDAGRIEDSTFDETYASPADDEHVGNEPPRRPVDGFTVAGRLMLIETGIAVAGAIATFLFWSWVPSWSLLTRLIEVGLGIGLIRSGRHFARPTLLWFAFGIASSAWSLLTRTPFPSSGYVVIPIGLGLLKALPVASLLVGRPSRSRIRFAIVGFVAVQLMLAYSVIWRAQAVERYQRSVHPAAHDAE